MVGWLVVTKVECDCNLEVGELSPCSSDFFSVVVACVRWWVGGEL